MSIELQLKNANLKGSEGDRIKVQYIPANVEENIAANVSTYFDNYTEEIDGVKRNALRGFPLDGCNFKVPDNFQGIVFQETQRPMEENARRTFKVRGAFDELIYWNYDKKPSQNDQLQQALLWSDFANAVHSPITADEFERTE